MPSLASRKKSQRVWLFAFVLSVFAFLLRWYYVSTAMVADPIQGDAVEYYSYAWNLVHHHVFSIAPPTTLTANPDSYRSPGYPVFLASLMLLTDRQDLWYALVLMSQAALGGIVAGLIFALARLWLPLGWSLLAGIIVAVWPHNVTACSYLLSETLFSACATAALLIYGLALVHERKLTTVAAGFVLGLAILVNSVLWPLTILLPLVAMFRSNVSKRLLLVFACSAIALPLTWQIRSWTVDDVSGKSSSDRVVRNLVQGSWPFFLQAWRASYFGDADAHRVLDEVENERLLVVADPIAGYTAIAKRMSAAPFRYLLWYAIQKPAALWSWNILIGEGDIYVFPAAESPFKTQPLLRAIVAACKGINPVIGLFAMAVAVTTLLRKRDLRQADQRRRAVLFAISLSVIYVTAVHAVLQAEPRYSVPYRPLEIVLAVTAMAWMWERWLAMRHRAILSESEGRPNESAAKKPA